MNLSEIRTEVQARGFDYLNSTRLNYFINSAYQRICGRYNWPFLETTTTGTAPLAISDLRTILFVLDSSAETPLRGIDQRDLREVDPALSSSGNPEFFYLQDTTVAVWPVNTSNTLTVRYVKSPATLSSDADTPVIPERFHYLLVDGAVLLAYADSDDAGSRDVLYGYHERDIAAMARELLSPNHSNPPTVDQTRGIDSYGC